MYRFMVILGSATSAVLCAFAIYFQIMALAKWRADDLFTATRVTDFTTLGSCVEVITSDQISAGLSDSGCEGSGTDEELTGSLGNLRNTLAVSVHGLYYAYAVAGVTNWQLKEVATSVISSTINPNGDTVGLGVNFTAAKGALEQVAESSVPTSCDTIYSPHVPSDVTGDPTANAFYKSLIAGRKDKDDSDDTRGDWPLADIAVDCEGATQTAALNQVDLDALTAAQKLELYAHCLAQFQFAASGTDPWAGTYGIPLVGVEPGPTGMAWYPMADGFNRTHNVDYNTKARMYLGMRFGYAVWAYIPMLIASCYLCADAVVFFMAEATLPDVLNEVQTISQDRLSMVQDRSSWPRPARPRARSASPLRCLRSSSPFWPTCSL